MIFRRSPASLGVLHRFYRVDVVVFCEGGPSVAVADAVAGGGSEDTYDILYWSFVVQHLNIGKRFHFKSVGSKATLQALSNDVQKENLDTITICLDRDYDWLTGRNLPHNRLAYTYGYSWENDVLQAEVLRHLFESFVGVGQKQAHAFDAMLVQMAKYSAGVARWCEIDISLISKGKAGIFDREKPLFCADLNASPPCLRPESLKRRLGQMGYTRGPKKVVSVSKQDSLQVCFGRAISHYVYHLFLHYLKSVSPRIRVQYDNFVRLAIRQTIDLVAAGALPHLQSHIANQRNAF